jgi:SAM-dependent methyltransferase
MLSNMDSLYTGGGYLETHPTWHAEDAAWKAAQLFALFRDRHVRPATVCEVGCGSGEILRELERAMPKTTRFTGYDISADALAMAAKKPTAHVRFVLGDFLKTSEQYDLLLLMDVVEHVEDYYTFLKAVRGRARQFAFHFPLDASAQALIRLKPLMDARFRTGHLHYFFKDQVVSLLKECGYRLVEYRYTASGVDRPAGSPANWLARLPRRFLFRFWPDFTVRLLGGYSLLVLAEPIR